ncbi:atlastin-like [Bradysia coprophila]|uniref:atlastin-like n=1 Tax=Bradysia coprophila TaxID=38358 RepID=UPI00187DD530|nr:atlastin-like [Bradysia coprophila]
MMLSSVQCFNVMYNIQADHLQHFRSVTEYGTLASKRLAGKPFQKLIFLVRDSSNALGYGYHDGSRLVDEMVATNATNGDQTADMFEMIRRIAERFDKIGVFLMPQPGMTVTQGHEFSGAVPDPEFQDCVKELSHHLFAPENLIFKQINGERVRAGDLVQCIQAYVRVFNSNNLPDMDALLKATLEVIDSMLINECVKFYRLAI